MTTILFDLDGTLINTSSIVLPAFKQTLQEFHQPIPDDETLRGTFGMPDDEIWKMLMPTADAATRSAAFRRSETAITAAMYQTDILIAHAKEVLAALVANGHTLTTASNCGSGYLQAVLESQGLTDFFTRPLCLGTVAGTTKADILGEHFKWLDKHTAVMVGDRKSDVEAAQAHGIPVIGCELGFAKGDELSEANVIIHDLRELLQWFPEGQTVPPSFSTPRQNQVSTSASSPT